MSNHPPSAPPEDLIVISSSANGIEALSTLVATLPQNFPAPLVLAQQLDPNRTNSLATMLQRSTTLRVEIVAARARLEPGTIYVVPSNRHVMIEEGHVTVETNAGVRLQPSIDLLLTTAAAAYGEHLIAVILHGTSADGTTGAVEVKQAGGTVVIQNPRTTRYPAMTLALPPTVVDCEIDIEQMGQLLYDLVTRTRLPQESEKTEDTLRAILQFVMAQTNTDFRQYKASTLLRRIGRRMVVTQTITMRDYLQYLRKHAAEVGELVTSFLINVTQFFRDPEAFILLRNDVLPQLIERGRERYNTLRFWSAGCATGEEAYSLAILLVDLLGDELPHWNIKIFATDLDEEAIMFARRGAYTINMLIGLPEEYRERFFDWSQQQFRLTKVVRQLVIFGQQDLSRSAPFPRIDLVLCRNLLIYFTPELQEYVLSQFVFSLAPNGYLFLGKAETVRPNQAFYEVINKQWKIYRCIGDTVMMPRRYGFSSNSLPGWDNSRQKRLARTPTVLPSEGDSTAPSVELSQIRRMNEFLLRFLPIGVVIIDRTYQLLTANTAARRLLALRDLHTDPDFLHAVRGLPYTEVRSAIDSVFRDRTSVTLSDLRLEPLAGGEPRYLTLTIVIMSMESGTPDLATISVYDVTEQLELRQRLEAAQSAQAQLVHELEVANQRLSESNKELVDANEELQIANEEMVLTHEELQATSEEFEATNEELQATNEELETNNEEMHATNEELQATNDEMRARTNEQQELATQLANERVRLAEMVELAPFDIMVLRGPGLVLEAFSQRYGQLMAGRDLINRPIEEVIELFGKTDHSLAELAHRSYETGEAQTTARLPLSLLNERNEQAETFFVYSIVPTHDAQSKVNGVIIYAFDETAQRVRELEEKSRQIQLIFEHVEQTAMALYAASNGELLVASPRYLAFVEQLRGFKHEQSLGRSFEQLSFWTQPEQANSIWQQVINDRQPVRLTDVAVQVGSNMPTQFWDWIVSPIAAVASSERTDFVLSTGVEITQQVLTRAKLEQLDRLKDEFLSLASHELRTPLTSLRGYAEMLNTLIDDKTTDAVKRQPRLEQLIGRVNRQIDRLERQVGDLTDVTRLQSGKFTLHRESLNLVDVLRRAAEEARVINPQYPINLSLPDEQRIKVIGDLERLLQVLLNLIQNAMKYAYPNEPGPIELRVLVRMASNGQSASQQMAEISVQDYGVGIPPEDQEGLFTRFYQVQRAEEHQRGGMGLGLFICKQIIDQHGGTLSVVSQPNNGTTFTVCLLIQP